MEMFETYLEMRQHVRDLFHQAQYAEAAKVLTWGLEAFPDHLMANAYNLALCLVFDGQHEAALPVLQRGIEGGGWYGIWSFAADYWDPLREDVAFAKLLEENEARRLEAQRDVEPALLVVTPDGYTPDKSYPLFVALHGGNETLEVFKPRWTCPTLQRDFVVAYLQSSQVSSMDGFSWMDYDLAKREIINAYHAVVAEYAIDEHAVLMGGFSAGGRTTLSLLLDEDATVPARGFVVLAPPKPDALDAQGVAHIKARGVRGTMLTTEMDPRLEDQRAVVAALQEGGVPCRLVVTPDIGHWYPDDLADQLDAAIRDILEEV